MPSSFMVKRNYSNCPLKKRPLALYNETTAPEQEEPEDLSVKKPRVETTTTFVPEVYVPQPQVVRREPHWMPPQPNFVYRDYYPTKLPVQPVASPVSSDTVPRYQPASPDSSQNSENLPTLAEYYLQLFRATSEAEKKESTRQYNWHSPQYLPPSPQPSPVTPEQLRSSCSPAGSARLHNTSPLPYYPDTSALISPVSSCSSTASEDEEEIKEVQSEYRSTRHVCDSCGKSYSTPSGLNKHKQLHCTALGPRIFACKHCAKTYTSVGALKMHIRTHTLPCKCHICGKAFSRPWLLQGHIRTHTGEKPFECTQCDRSFADRSNLRAHLQTHAHVKKYACTGCHKTFSRMSLLNKHMESACITTKPSNPEPKIYHVENFDAPINIMS